MQAPASKDKKWGGPASKEDPPAVAMDPDYENITLTLKHRDPPKGRGKHPKNPGPAPRGSSSAPTQAPHWMYRAILSLYFFLALTFVFCIVLSAFILVKNTEMSQELRELKTGLSNISNSLRDCQEVQKAGQDTLLKAFQEEQESINNQQKTINSYNGKLDSIIKDTVHIKNKVSAISQMLDKLKPTPGPPAPPAPSK